MTPNNSELENMAELLHLWYLEATQKLDPENYNPKAQKSYAELNEQQKNIDRYIAEKTLALIHTETQGAVVGELEQLKIEASKDSDAFNADYGKNLLDRLNERIATINHKEKKS